MSWCWQLAVPEAWLVLKAHRWLQKTTGISVQRTSRPLPPHRFPSVCLPQTVRAVFRATFRPVEDVCCVFRSFASLRLLYCGPHNKQHSFSVMMPDEENRLVEVLSFKVQSLTVNTGAVTLQRMSFGLCE